MNPVMPPKLRPGDRIGLVAPAGPFSRERFDRGVEFLKSLGFRVAFSDGVFSSHGYLAGDDASRAADLNRMAADADVAAVMPVRGGYGAMRLFGRIDYATIASRPKIWLGFSDICALHAAIHRKTGLVTFHTPHLVSLPDADGDVHRRWLGLIAEADAPESLFPKPLELWRPGVAEGRLVPMNLAMLASLVGTPFFPDLDGAILAVEDTGEAAYRIDRMLTQLELAGAFRRLSGLIVGRFTPPKEAVSGYHELVRARFLELADRYLLPTLGDAPFGHIDNNYPLPAYVQARLDAEEGTIGVLEAAVC